MDISQISTLSLPANPAKINTISYVLDPLSVIIKLAIISNKPIGTKICIQNNVMYLQEPGLFQGLCRYFYNTNKTDLQFMYNPIHIACDVYLGKNATYRPRINALFECAKNGLHKLMETYKNCLILQQCLNYHFAIIDNALLNSKHCIFNKDIMTHLYTSELVEKMNALWSEDKIAIVLNLIDFLQKDVMASDNVKALENIIDNVDKQISFIF